MSVGAALKVGLALAVGAAGAGGVVLASSDTQGPVTVVKVVDGDTIDVDRGGEVQRVRLLNIDTPESVDPDEAIECLGPEASDFLRDLLPIGTEVRLEHDVERMDGYDRELAGVFVGDRLVNAEIARAGFGVAMVIQPNERFLDQVRAAQTEALVAGRGLYADDIECTVPTQVQQVEEAVTAATATPPEVTAGVQEFDEYGDELARIAVRVRTLSRLLQPGHNAFPLLAFDESDVVRFRSRADVAERRLESAESQNERQRAAKVERIEAERAAKARRIEARRAEEARREAARQAEEARRATERAPSSGGSSSSGSAPQQPQPTGGYDGYTGCRAYGQGGTSIDEKGLPYTKIDCTTKLPIG